MENLFFSSIQPLFTKTMDVIHLILGQAMAGIMMSLNSGLSLQYSYTVFLVVCISILCVSCLCSAFRRHAHTLSLFALHAICAAPTAQPISLFPVYLAIIIIFMRKPSSLSTEAFVQSLAILTTILHSKTDLSMPPSATDLIVLVRNADTFLKFVIGLLCMMGGGLARKAYNQKWGFLATIMIGLVPAALRFSEQLHSDQALVLFHILISVKQLFHTLARRNIKMACSFLILLVVVACFAMSSIDWKQINSFITDEVCNSVSCLEDRKRTKTWVQSHRVREWVQVPDTWMNWAKGFVWELQPYTKLVEVFDTTVIEYLLPCDEVLKDFFIVTNFDPARPFIWIQIFKQPWVRNALMKRAVILTSDLINVVYSRLASDLGTLLSYMFAFLAKNTMACGLCCAVPFFLLHYYLRGIPINDRASTKLQKFRLLIQVDDLVSRAEAKFMRLALPIFTGIHQNADLSAYSVEPIRYMAPAAMLCSLWCGITTGICSTLPNTTFWDVCYFLLDLLPIGFVIFQLGLYSVIVDWMKKCEKAQAQVLWLIGIIRKLHLLVVFACRRVQADGRKIQALVGELHAANTAIANRDQVIAKCTQRLSDLGKHKLVPKRRCAKRVKTVEASQLCFFLKKHFELEFKKKKAEIERLTKLAEKLDKGDPEELLQKISDLKAAKYKVEEGKAQAERSLRIVSEKLVLADAELDLQDEELKSAKDELSANNESHGREIQGMSWHVRSCDNTISEQKQIISDQKITISGLEKKYVRALSHISKQQTSRHVQVNNLQTAAQASQAEITRLTKVLKDENNKVTGLKQDLANVRTEQTAYQDEVEQEKKRAQERDWRRTGKQIAKEKNYEKDLKLAKATIQEYSDTLSTTTREKKGLECIVQERDKQISGMETVKTNLVQRSKDEFTRLRGIISRTNAEKTALDCTLQERDEKISELQKLIAELREKLQKPDDQPKDDSSPGDSPGDDNHGSDQGPAEQNGHDRADRPDDNEDTDRKGGDDDNNSDDDDPDDNRGGNKQADVHSVAPTTICSAPNGSVKIPDLPASLPTDVASAITDALVTDTLQTASSTDDDGPNATPTEGVGMNRPGTVINEPSQDLPTIGDSGTVDAAEDQLEKHGDSRVASTEATTTTTTDDDSDDGAELDELADQILREMLEKMDLDDTPITNHLV